MARSSTRVGRIDHSGRGHGSSWPSGPVRPRRGLVERQARSARRVRGHDMDRRLALGDRRRSGDGPDLPPRGRTCRSSRRTRCSGPTRGERPCGPTTRGTPPIAARAGAGLRLESPTWRANPDWGARARPRRDGPGRVNHAAIEFLRGLADEWGDRVDGRSVVGMVGPRGDGYAAGERGRPGRGGRLPRRPGGVVRRRRGRPGAGADHDRHRRGARGRAGGRGVGHPGGRSRSRSRPTAGCPTAPRWRRR